MRAFFKSNRGNAIFLIMIAIFLLGMLAKIMAERNTDTASIANNTGNKIQAHQVVTRAISMRNAAVKIINEGIAAGNIDDVNPSDTVNYQAGDHRPKLYHPYGGGIQYQQDFKGWTNILIHKNAAITNVGPGATAEIMAVGKVDRALCESINTKLFGDSTITVVQDSAFNALADGSTIVTLVDGTTCPGGSCNGRAYQCVGNASATEYLYYHTLYAR